MYFLGMPFLIIAYYDTSLALVILYSSEGYQVLAIFKNYTLYNTKKNNING